MADNALTKLSLNGQIGASIAAAALVGGLFYHNYPGGSGLTSGMVFGRRAGASAATFARQRATL